MMGPSTVLNMEHIPLWSVYSLYTVFCTLRKLKAKPATASILNPFNPSHFLAPLHEIHFIIILPSMCTRQNSYLCIHNLFYTAIRF